MRLRLLYLLYDIELTLKNNKTGFSMFCTLMKHGVLSNQGAIYVDLCYKFNLENTEMYIKKYIRQSRKSSVLLYLVVRALKINILVVLNLCWNIFFNSLGVARWIHGTQLVHRECRSVLATFQRGNRRCSTPLLKTRLRKLLLNCHWCKIEHLAS